MLEQLKLQAKEIIEMCDKSIALNNSPNLFEINVIKREFLLIRDVLIRDNKIVVLTKQRDLWAYRVILDSAKLEYDSDLFEKVYQFQKSCKKLSKKQLIIQYN